MQRMESLPDIACERGRGLAEIRGWDPLDRRVEVEKKERYAQALRDQMAVNASLQAAARPDTSSPGAGRTASLGTRVVGGSTLAGIGGARIAGDTRFLDVGSPCSAPYLGSAPSLSTPPRSPITGGDPSRVAADKVAQVQEMMRQRLQALHEEQNRQWQSIQAALRDQLGSARETAEEAVRREVGAALREQAAEISQLRAAVGDVAALRHASGEQGRRGEQLADELAEVKRALSRLEAQVQGHHEVLQEHARELERLRVSHQECQRYHQDAARERAELLRAQRASDETVARLRAQCQEQASAVERLEANHLECGRCRAEMQREQRAADEMLVRLRAEQAALAARAAEFPALLARLREEVPRLAAAAPREVADRLRPRELPPPTPPREPSPPRLVADVSPLAFAVLRGAEGAVHELPSLENSVGRSPTCGACVPGFQAVSNRHASIDIDNDGHSAIRDLGSRNGTFVNDHRVPPGSGLVLRSGDVVRLGADGPAFVFEYGPAYFARWPREPERAPAGPRRGGRSESPWK